MRLTWIPIVTAAFVASLITVPLIGSPAGTGSAASADQPVQVVIAPMEGTVARGPTLVFGSFNICKTDCAPPAPSWEVRRERVARVIAESGVDVIGLQEATFWPTANAKTQLLDVQGLLAPAGYVQPIFTTDSDECRWTAVGAKACTHTTGVLFNSRTVRQVATANGTPSAGTLPMSEIVGGLTPDAAPRKVTWVYLEGLNGTRTFLAVAVHTSNLKDPANEVGRIAVGSALTGWVDAFNEQHGMAGTPVILLADLNSYRKRQPHGAQQLLVDAGWIDAGTAPVKRNVQYSTINYNPLLGVAEQGFPVKPYVFHTSRRNPVLDATRIDYVMARGPGVSAVDYEVVIHLGPDGSFDPAYQASDHQMVRATIAFAGG
jgi:endonuclease/exonuclease/phosphatase family metal-dependent hydrolase